MLRDLSKILLSHIFFLLMLLIYVNLINVCANIGVIIVRPEKKALRNEQKIFLVDKRKHKLFISLLRLFSFQMPSLRSSFSELFYIWKHTCEANINIAIISLNFLWYNSFLGFQTFVYTAIEKFFREINKN